MGFFVCLFVSSLFLLFGTLYPSSVATTLMGKRDLITLLQLSFCCLVTVSVLSYVGWSAVYDCAITWSYSLAFSKRILVIFAR